MERLVRQLVVHVVGRVRPKRVRKRLRAVELMEPTLQVARVTNLHVLREARVGEDIDDAFAHSSVSPHCFIVYRCIYHIGEIA